jgi:hypothetical protein
MVRFELEMLAGVGDFSVNFGGQCHLFPDDQNIVKGITLSDSFHNELDGGP